MGNKLRALAAAAGLAIAATSIAGAPAQAVGYGPPTTGDHVSYRNCQGPYNSGGWSMSGVWKRPLYYCWADYDLWAEWTRGEVDRWTWVYGYVYANA